MSGKSSKEPGVMELFSVRNPGYVWLKLFRLHVLARIKECLNSLTLKNVAGEFLFAHDDLMAFSSTSTVLCPLSAVRAPQVKV